MSDALVAKIIRLKPGEITQPLLEKLSAAEPEIVCRFLGIAFSGKKTERIERILQSLSLRQTLARYSADEFGIADLMHDFRLKALQLMCRKAQIYMGGSKREAVVSLLNWRAGCRRKGEQYLTLCRSAADQQIALFPPHEFVTLN